jgi:hypothetical protein
MVTFFWIGTITATTSNKTLLLAYVKGNGIYREHDPEACNAPSTTCAISARNNIIVRMMQDAVAAVLAGVVLTQRGDCDVPLIGCPMFLVSPRSGEYGSMWLLFHCTK